MTDLPSEKKAARAAAAEARRAASQAAMPGAARLAAGFALEALAPVHAVRRVSVFLPIRTEIDTMPLVRALDGLGYKLCLPVAVERGKRLEFRAWRPGDPMERCGFGTDTPVGGDPVDPDVLFVPLLAFDDDGYRLGYGGGYYDRTLASLRGKGDVHAFGFAYAGQRVDRVPRGETDARLDAVITEAGIHRPS